MERWKQRFKNFEQALDELKRALNIKSLSFLELAGLIKLFELTFELAWKVIKDILEEERLLINESISSPRRIIKIAVQNNFLKENDGFIWIKALEDLNFLTDTYNQNFAKKSESEIRNVYFPLLERLYEKCKKENNIFKSISF